MEPALLQAAFVLHSRRYGDSSLIVDLFTRECGRLAAIAKGALRARRPSVQIQPFQPMLVELRGRGEVLTLVRCEAGGAPRALAGRRLFCAIYVNELVLKLTARQDSCTGLFDDYGKAIAELAGVSPAEPVLRRFEVQLLQHLGLGLQLELDESGQAIEPCSSYTYHVSSGASPAAGNSPGVVSGKTLLALRRGEFSDPECLREARTLMRQILNHHLDGRPLHSRELFQ